MAPGIGNNGMKRPRLASLLLAARFDPPTFAAHVMLEAHGSVHSVPYHRVREVYRDGELIWQRPEPPVAQRR